MLSRVALLKSFVAVGLPIALLVATLCAGCPNPLPDPPRPAVGATDGAVSVSAEPASALDALAAVVRIRVELTAGYNVAPADLELFEGILSDYHVGRIEQRDLPNTLLERKIEALVWSENAGHVLVLAPSVPLVSGHSYSLASPSLGLISVVSVTGSQALSYAVRVWPPPDAGQGAGHSIYCTDAGMLTTEQNLELMPAGVVGRLGPGADETRAFAETCAHIEVAEPLELGASVVPPPEISGVAFDPTPLQEHHTLAANPASCEQGDLPSSRAAEGEVERQFGPGCANVLDDRLVVRSFDDAALWIVHGPAGSTMTAVAPGGRLVVTGLLPEASNEISLAVVDRAGRVSRSSETVQTEGVRPHVVLNEVLANPVGEEPKQEWIELFNDGLAAVDLAGWVVSDVGGPTELPSHVIEPGGFVLIAAQGFDSASATDVEPVSGVSVLLVPKLGKGGLSNAGEPLELRSVEGVVVSRFPAVPAAKAGTSVARLRPSALDDDPSSFAAHASPGASPGAPNAW